MRRRDTPVTGWCDRPDHPPRSTRSTGEGRMEQWHIVYLKTGECSTTRLRVAPPPIKEFVSTIFWIEEKSSVLCEG